MIAKCDYPGCNANAALFSPSCYHHREPVISEGERACDECGFTFTPENEDDAYCDLCQYHDRNDRAYQAMEGYR